MSPLSLSLSLAVGGTTVGPRRSLKSDVELEIRPASDAGTIKCTKLLPNGSMQLQVRGGCVVLFVTEHALCELPPHLSLSVYIYIYTFVNILLV